MVRTAPASPYVGTPLVSVVMSVYNGEPFLGEAVESILLQSLDDFEFIVIDDGSSDGTWCLLQAYAERDPRIRLVRNETNIGLTASLNIALDLAAGKYIARQDSDDVSFNNRLQEQVKRLDTDLSLVLVGSACQVIDAIGKVLRTDSYPETDTAIRWRMLLDNAFAHSSIMIRRQILVAHNLRYDERCRFAQDYELWSRLLQYGSGANTAVPLIRYRVHGQNLGNLFSSSQDDIASDIARSNIRRLGMEVPLTEMQTLKKWERNEIVTPDDDFPRDFGLLLALIELFARTHQNDREELREIRCRWMIRGLTGFPLSRLLAPEYARLFLKTLWLDPTGFLIKLFHYWRKNVYCALVGRSRY